MTVSRTLIIMVKEPRVGRVKTRLGRDIGRLEATIWYRRQLGRLLARVGHDRRWTTVLAIAPDVAITSPMLPAGLLRRPQGTGDLGERMARQLRAPRGGPAVLIGSDIPDVTAPRIACAFRALGRADAVFGPAPDGGYWLIGTRHAHSGGRSFLEDVRWSHAQTLSDSLASLPPAARVAMTGSLQDIDVADDLSSVQSPGFPKKRLALASMP